MAPLPLPADYLCIAGPPVEKNNNNNNNNNGNKNDSSSSNTEWTRERGQLHNDGEKIKSSRQAPHWRLSPIVVGGGISNSMINTDRQRFLSPTMGPGRSG